MRAIDTNVVVRLITRDDPRQATAAESIVKGGAWLSVIALAETAWVLDSVYEFSRKQLIAALEMLLDHEHIVVDQPAIVERAIAVFRSRPRVTFSDCLLIELARQAGCLPLSTFDRDLARLESAELISS
jgi:predicted nucleic-acid-binding protein